MYFLFSLLKLPRILAFPAKYHRILIVGRTSSVTAMLQKLQWDSFQQRRARSRVLMLYRIRTGFVAIPAAAYLEPVSSAPEGSKRDMCWFSAIQAHTVRHFSKFNPAVEHSGGIQLPAPVYLLTFSKPSSAVFVSFEHRTTSCSYRLHCTVFI